MYQYTDSPNCCYPWSHQQQTKLLITQPSCKHFYLYLGWMEELWSKQCLWQSSPWFRLSGSYFLCKVWGLTSLKLVSNRISVLNDPCTVNPVSTVPSKIFELGPILQRFTKLGKLLCQNDSFNTENLLNQEGKSIFLTHFNKICWASFLKCWANFATYSLWGYAAQQTLGKPTNPTIYFFKSAEKNIILLTDPQFCS